MLIDFWRHMERLRRSLGAIDMDLKTSDQELLHIHRQLLERNNLHEGLVYLHVSRGVADRDFVMPDVDPTLVLFTQKKDLLNSPAIQRGYKVISVADQRWQRRDIKTVQLLFPSMAKTEAIRTGVDDAWLVEDGYVNEGSANNAYIIRPSGDIVTRHLSSRILAGITRRAVLRYARKAGVKVVEEPFTIAEAQGAAEAFVTAASLFVAPVVEVDGVPIGNGKPGPMVRKLRDLYLKECRNSAC